MCLDRCRTLRTTASCCFYLRESDVTECKKEYDGIQSKSFFSLKLTPPVRARVHLENLRVMRRSRGALVFLDFTQEKRGVSLLATFRLRLLLGEDGWWTWGQETPPHKQF